MLPTNDFKITSSRYGDEWRIVATGELDIATAPVLDAACQEAHTSDARRIVVDLAGLRFVDSTGLRALLNIAGACEEGRLRMVSAPALDRVAEIAGVRDLLPLAGSSPEA
jgi:anti-sigma B factor antagonist